MWKFMSDTGNTVSNINAYIMHLYYICLKNYFQECSSRNRQVFKGREQLIMRFLYLGNTPVT